jgi:hypothetical protein
MDANTSVGMGVGSSNYTSTPIYETDDKNLAALLRAKDISQVGRRQVQSGDPDRPHFYFQFDNTNKAAEQIKEAALMGGIQVNYRRFVQEQNAVMDQIFEHKRRITGDGELPPFLSRRYKRG